jgi:hypothetical protein
MKVFRTNPIVAAVKILSHRVMSPCAGEFDFDKFHAGKGEHLREIDDDGGITVVRVSNGNGPVRVGRVGDYLVEFDNGTYSIIPEELGGFVETAGVMICM